MVIPSFKGSMGSVFREINQLGELPGTCTCILVAVSAACFDDVNRKDKRSNINDKNSINKLYS